MVFRPSFSDEHMYITMYRVSLFCIKLYDNTTTSPFCTSRGEHGFMIYDLAVALNMRTYELNEGLSMINLATTFDVRIISQEKAF